MSSAIQILSSDDWAVISQKHSAAFSRKATKRGAHLGIARHGAAEADGHQRATLPEALDGGGDGCRMAGAIQRCLNSQTVEAPVCILSGRYETVCHHQNPETLEYRGSTSATAVPYCRSMTVRTGIVAEDRCSVRVGCLESQFRPQFHRMQVFEHNILSLSDFAGSQRANDLDVLLNSALG